MARPRKVSDDRVYAAALRVMRRVGPGDLTLGLIAAEAGLTAGALVQRFGSKRDLLLRLNALLASGTDDLFAQLRARHRRPLDVIRAYAACMADLAVTPEALARNFAYLQADLADPDIRRQLLRTARATHRTLRALIREAREEGDLRRETPERALARSIEAMISGALLTWAFYRKGTARAWLKGHVEALLAPYVSA